jgi:hypothetical protein
MDYLKGRIRHGRAFRITQYCKTALPRLTGPAAVVPDTVNLWWFGTEGGDQIPCCQFSKENDKE